MSVHSERAKRSENGGGVTLYAFLDRTLVGRFFKGSGFSRALGRNAGLSSHITFSYDERYRWQSGATPLSLSLPIEEGDFFDDRPAIFLDALVSESMESRENTARLHKSGSVDAFDLLMAVGLDPSGALRLSADSTIPQRDDRVSPISDAQIAVRLREAAPSGLQPATEQEHWAVAGQQGKIALLWKNGQWYSAEGTARTTHIIKPGIPGLPDQAFDEHFTMRIAHFLGLNVAETKFVLFEGVPAIVVTRFDRHLNEQGEVEAVHQVDFTQALGVSAREKYEEYGGPRSERYAVMLRQHDAFHEAERNVQGFADGIMTSYLLGSTDGHAKNYSLILEGTRVTLAPLYDLASVFPYAGSAAHGYSTTLAMTIGGQRKLLQLRAKHLRRFAQRMHLAEDAVLGRFAMLVRALPEAFDAAVEENRSLLPRLANEHFVDAYGKRLRLTYDDALSWIAA